MADEKILENEKLDDEQLDEVAGGYGKEIKEDKQFLYNLGILRSPDASDQELKNAFALYGIEANIHHGYMTANSYKLADGTKLNHQQVMGYIQTKTRRF